MKNAIKGVLRLPKRHVSKLQSEPSAADGARIINAQSVRDAVMAALIVVILFSAMWSILSALINRIFPWMTLVLGLLIGLTVRRAGQGLDWRFPAIAASMAVLGALAGNIVVAAAFTATALDTTTLTVLRAVTTMTWPVFFDEVLTPADAVFALFAAAIAASYANRRLSRAEFLALRKWEKQQETAERS
ncbi:MAG: hypothetical protein IIA07_00425 [Proteobacteria bacterium]|nr:hypothetical protein [Pseudomonadota bacterium]